MSTASNLSPISADDYLRGELTARRKHEYVDGEVYAMSGATNVHNVIATNVTVALGMQPRGKRCRAFNSDTKVRVQFPQGLRFYYPDAMVVCQGNPPTDTFQDAPVVIVEVLSTTTRRTDENEKRDAYLSIPSLSVYIRIEMTSAVAAVDRRGAAGFRRESYVGLDAVIPLPEVDGQLRLVDVYDDVDFASVATADIDIDDD